MKRLVTLSAEVSLFLRENRKPTLGTVGLGLAYLEDIFGHVNEVNISIQSHEVTIMNAAERMKAFLAAVEKEVGGRQLCKLSSVRRSASAGWK